MAIADAGPNVCLRAQVTPQPKGRSHLRKEISNENDDDDVTSEAGDIDPKEEAREEEEVDAMSIDEDDEVSRILALRELVYDCPGQGRMLILVMPSFSLAIHLLCTFPFLWSYSSRYLRPHQISRYSLPHQSKCQPRASVSNRKNAELRTGH